MAGRQVKLGFFRPVKWGAIRGSHLVIGLGSQHWRDDEDGGEEREYSDGVQHHCRRTSDGVDLSSQEMQIAKSRWGVYIWGWRPDLPSLGGSRHDKDYRDPYFRQNEVHKYSLLFSKYRNGRVIFVILHFLLYPNLYFPKLCISITCGPNKMSFYFIM